jgi:hypothetical protein
MKSRQALASLFELVLNTFIPRVYEVTESHNDVMTISGFKVEINGTPVQDITAVGGLNRETGTIEWTDGGTGLTEMFTDQRRKFGPLNLRYMVDPTRGDFDRLHSYVTASQALGVRYNFSIIKYHKQIEIFRVNVYKALFSKEALPELNKNQAGAFEVQLDVAIAFWEIVR